MNRRMGIHVWVHLLTSGHQLLHEDRGFDPVEQVLGLQVVHP